MLKSLKAYPGYKIDPLGNVFNRRGKQLSINTDGTPSVKLTDSKGKRVHLSLPRLMVETYKKPLPKKTKVYQRVKSDFSLKSFFITDNPKKAYQEIKTMPYKTGKTFIKSGLFGTDPDTPFQGLLKQKNIRRNIDYKLNKKSGFPKTIFLILTFKNPTTQETRVASFEYPINAGLRIEDVEEWMDELVMESLLDGMYPDGSGANIEDFDLIDWSLKFIY